jgi:hypothetical protein
MAEKKTKIAEEPEVVAEQGGSTALLDYDYTVADGVVTPDPEPAPK